MCHCDSNISVEHFFEQVVWLAMAYEHLLILVGCLTSIVVRIPDWWDLDGAPAADAVPWPTPTRAWAAPPAYVLEVLFHAGIEVSP